MHAATGLIIRRATEIEIPAIETLNVAAYEEYRGEVPPRLFETYIEDLQRLANYWDDVEALVAELDGQIVGSALFYAHFTAHRVGLPTGWAGFRKLAICPTKRRMGLARQITERCIALATQSGAHAIGIHTASFMHAACALYEQIGFERYPEYDLRAADLLTTDEALADIPAIAYRLDLSQARGAVESS